MTPSSPKGLGLCCAAFLLVAHCTWPTLATRTRPARRQLLQGTDQTSVPAMTLCRRVKDGATAQRMVSLDEDIDDVANINAGSGPAVSPGQELTYTGLTIDSYAIGVAAWAVIKDGAGGLWMYPASDLDYCATSGCDVAAGLSATENGATCKEDIECCPGLTCVERPAEAQQVTLFDQTAQRNREFIVDAIGLDLLPKYCAPTGAASATCGHTAADLMNAILLWGAGARVQYPNGEGNSVIWVPEADKVCCEDTDFMEKYHLLSVESWICDSFNPAWDELYHTFCTSSKVQLAQLQAVWAGNSTTCPDGYATTLNKIARSCRDGLAADAAADSDGGSKGGWVRLFDACYA